MRTEICILKFEAGKKIGAYTLLAPCGEGAYGKVFLAENTLTKQQVALKVVWGCGRELKGITAYQTICRQTNLLQIWHVEAAEDFFYYTMDPADDLAEPGSPYLPDTLANRLKKYGKLPPEQVRRMAQDVMEALRILHGKGMVHRDIKPENILWIKGRAVPGDVGLVSADARATLAGTPGFMPPEVLAGIRPYEEKDDLYGLGKVLYCALTGLPPEKFPSFPDSRTLKGCSDIISLYHKLCAGKKIDYPQSCSPLSSRLKLIAWVTAALLFLAGSIITLAVMMPERNATLAPSVGENAPIPLEERLAVLEKMESSPDFYRIENRVRVELNRLHRLRNNVIADAWKAGNGNYEQQKHLAEQAEMTFESNHKETPEWQYYRTFGEIIRISSKIRQLLKNDPGQAERLYGELVRLHTEREKWESRLVRKYNF